MKYLFILGLLSPIMVTACASNPKANIKYYPVITVVDVSVVQTLTCDDSNNVHTATAATFSPVHSADKSNAPISIPLHDLDGPLVNANLDISRYQDGRLRSVNSTSAGQGQAVFMAGLQVASTLLPIPAILSSGPFTSECNFINGNRMVGGMPARDRTATITYQTRLETSNLTSGAVSSALNPTPQTSGIHANLSKAVGPIKTKISNVIKGHELLSVDADDIDKKDVALSVQQPGIVEIEAWANVLDGNGVLADTKVSSARVPVAQAGTPYTVPISKSALFGTQTFLLEVAESGAVTRISYSDQSGLTQSLGTAQSVIDTISGPSTAEQASAIQAEANLIAQQQRLLRCRADASTCT